MRSLPTRKPSRCRRALPPVAFAAAALFILPCGPVRAQASSCPLLTGLQGTWQGRGEARRKPADAFEAIRCRLTAAWKPDAWHLSLNMQCKSADTDFYIRGTISVLPPGKRLSGVLVATPGRRNTNVTGTCDGRALNLLLVGGGGQAVGDRRLRIELPAGGKILSGRVWPAAQKAGAGGDLLTVRFSR